MTIYVWGIGGGTARIIHKWIPLEKISGFIVSDSTDNPTEYMGKRVYSVDEIQGKTYDAILVASVYTENIYNECVTYGYDLNKVIFLYRNCEVRSACNNEELVRRIFGNETAEAIRKTSVVIQDSALGEKSGCLSLPYENSGIYQVDYVRVRTFGLICDEINRRHISGNVAELGVFRGAFSKYINQAFPDRKLYLFDTFEGFNEAEIRNDIKQDADSFIESYKNTAVDVVLKKMKYPDNIVIKKGYFPDSLDGLEDHYAFVSIDVDLEKSIYNGLSYFYPRLNSGGYIMIHDYNNAEMQGVRRAVIAYEKNNHMTLCIVPLCDTAGTLVITKG